MQDVHRIGGGSGRLFGGGGDRRLSPHLHHHHQAAVKCPRCDSINTKFCYYNNYNLSQPRYYCKGCRRYWTNGGILRNVPVGGGCRKTKGSKPKPSSSHSPRDRKPKSHSSSESSAATTTTAAVDVASISTPTSASTLLNFPDSKFLNSPTTTNANFDPPSIDRSSDGEIFPGIGSFENMMTSSNDNSFLGFNMNDISSFRLQQNKYGEAVANQKMEELKAQIDVPEMESRRTYGGLASLDWQSDGGDQIQGMFDFTGTVDQAYWSQTQWAHNDHSLYLP